MQSRLINLALAFAIANLCPISVFITVLQLPAEAGRIYGFACNYRMNAKGKDIPTTVLLLLSGESKPLIRWESDSISNPKKMCEEVSARFDKLSRSGGLHKLKFTADKKTNQIIICGLSRQNKDLPCDKTNQLFELSEASKKLKQDPTQIIINLKRNMVTVDKGGGIFQNSDDEDVYLFDLEDWIAEQSANR